MLQGSPEEQTYWAAITGSLAHRAIEAADDRFSQKNIADELNDTGHKIHPGDTSSLFRLFEKYDLVDYRQHEGYGIVHGQFQHNFWRAAQLMIAATESVEAIIEQHEA